MQTVLGCFREGRLSYAVNVNVSREGEEVEVQMCVWGGFGRGGGWGCGRKKHPVQKRSRESWVLVIVLVEGPNGPIPSSGVEPRQRRDLHTSA